MNTLKAMLICLVLASPTALVADIIQVNGSGGTAIYNRDTPSLFGTGPSIGGGSFTFSVSGVPPSWVPGRFYTGYLTATLGNFSLRGNLSRIFFNPRTGLLQAHFQGQLRDSTGVRLLSMVHAEFYERVDLRNGALDGGYIAYSTAPEPGTTGLFVIGVGMIFLAGRQAGRRCLLQCQKD